MANLIQIKRSAATDAPSAGGLVTGELAYSLLNTSNSLFVGDGSNNAIRIAGGKYLWLHQANVSQPGALTANAVVIVNGNGYVTEWKTNKLIVGADGQAVNVDTISISANSTQLGNSAGGSNTELASTWAIKTYVDGKTASVAGVISNTQIAFSNSGVLTGSAGLTYDYVANTLGIANTTITGFANISGTLNVNGSVTLGDSFGVDVVSFISTVNTEISPSSNGSYKLGRSDLRWGEVNANNVLATNVAINTVLTVGSNVSLGTSTFTVGNSTVNTAITSTSINTDGSLDVLLATNLSNTLTTGGLANLHSANVVNDLKVAGVTTTANLVVGGTATDNAVFNAKVSSSIIPYHSGSFSLGNTTFKWLVHAANVFIDDTMTIGANVSVNTSTMVIGNSTVNVVTNSSVISVGGNVTLSTSTLNIGNSTVNTVVNSSVIVTGTVNATAINISQDLAVAGNLTVSGTLTTIDTVNLTIEDPLVRVANGNSTSDSVDIGIFGEFGNATVTQYTGFFRDASDAGIYKLFAGNIPVPSNTVDTGNVNFSLATLEARIKSGALVSNATSVYLTANSTVNVNITANSLTLSSPLIGTSGGTGLSSFTAEDILVANTTNGFRKLALGTNGYVLQSNGTALLYSTLDGGSF